MLAAAILAAGESRRMGTPKALLRVHGRTFADHLYGMLEHPRIGIRRIVLGAGAEEIRACLQVDPEAILINPDWPKGQLSSIHAAIRGLPPSASEGLMICPVDHALVSGALVATLIAEFDRTTKLIIVPSYRGRRGHPVIFRASLYSDLLEAPLDSGARHVMRAHRSDVLEIPTSDEGVVLNLNDPSALRSATLGRAEP